MYEQITHEEFEQTMEELFSKPAWLKVFSDCVNIDILYPEFEFLNLQNNQYLFGHKDYDEALEYQNIEININDIETIHRDILSIDEEQIILELRDGVQVVVECDY